jgi:hypothetical protein
MIVDVSFAPGPDGGGRGIKEDGHTGMGAVDATLICTPAPDWVGVWMRFPKV